MYIYSFCNFVFISVLNPSTRYLLETVCLCRSLSPCSLRDAFLLCCCCCLLAVAATCMRQYTSAYVMLLLLACCFRNLCVCAVCVC